MAKTVLITGANRGLGLGLVKRYLQLENHVVVAAVRDPAAGSSKTLFDLPAHASSKLIVVKIDATLHAEAFSAVEELKSKCTPNSHFRSSQMLTILRGDR